MVKRPERKTFYWIVFLQTAGLSFLLILLGWWETLFQRLASQVYSGDALGRFTRMIHWEFATIGATLFVVHSALFYFYWKDWRRSRSVQAFFASMTHELKTPLSSIRLQAETLASGLKWVDRILEDSSRLESQVEKTLELARLEGGGTLALTELPLVSWLEKSLIPSLDQVLLKNASIPLKLTGVSDAWVMADRFALQIVFRNILENIQRHATGTSRGAFIDVQKPSATTVLVEISDHGTQRDAPSDRIRFGELFAKGKSSSGTGVGLYLVKSLQEKMGGKAEFIETADRGFIVRLTFRAVENHG
jgi:signal transduction histidine kinase